MAGHNSAVYDFISLYNEGVNYDIGAFLTSTMENFAIFLVLAYFTLLALKNELNWGLWKVRTCSYLYPSIHTQINIFFLLLIMRQNKLAGAPL